MPRYKLLLTDYTWTEFDIEFDAYRAADAEIIFASETGSPQISAQLLADLAGKHEVDAIVTNWANVPRGVIAASSKLRHVPRLGIGVDNIDVNACTERGIFVTNVPDYCLHEVAEHALALMFALGRNVAWHHWATKQGEYNLKSGPMLHRLRGQTLGILGLGNIGLKVAELARNVGLQVIGTRRNRSKLVPGVEIVELDALLARSDFLSLHAPLTEETKQIIDRRALAKMKPTAYLINTSRGGLVENQALLEALEANALAGAALDVQSPEPPDLSLPLYCHPRVVVTPHIAFLSAESLAELRSRVARQVVDVLQGRKPEHIVNGL